MFTNFDTIYTDIHKQYKGINMKKNCKLCGEFKDDFLFYKANNRCIACWNAFRRNKYKKSICRHCLIEFRPDTRGRYKFCSEKCRFMNKVTINLETGCWNWTGHIQRKKGGYGTFAPIGKRSGLAHRVSFRLFNGHLDDKLLVLHSCHNPICVAPHHLRQGTPLDNTLDRKKAGRIHYPLNK